MDLQKEISVLKEEQNAVLLVHNYQRPEIQEIADYLGDSLGLAKTAAEIDAERIVFCGVRFMAETAKVLSPDKTVLLPKENAGCPMADMITAEELQQLKDKHSKAKVVAYVNSNVAVKALADVCCTSSNAIEVVKNTDADEIIFVPDKNLGHYASRFVDKKVILWDGYCYVHTRITVEEVKESRRNFPRAPVVVHPECRPEVIDMADEVLSTGGMVKYAREVSADTVLIGTEEGLIHRLNRENPEKKFFSIGTSKICQNMKLITLKSVKQALTEEHYQIEISEETRRRAHKAISAMLDYV